MKKSKIRFLIIPIIIILMGVSTFYLSKFLAIHELGLTDIYIAKVNIRHRTLIDESYLSKVKIPKAYINDEVIIDKSDIVGKYVVSDGYIPKGSLFYKNALQSIEQMEDGYFTRLKKNESSYDLKVKDIDVNTASLKQGQYVDLYLTINRKEVLSDLLITGARIIGIYDNQNKEVFTNKESNIQTITVAINKEMIPYLNKALAIGDIKIVTNSNLYSDQKCEINLSGDMLKYLS